MQLPLSDWVTYAFFDGTHPVNVVVSWRKSLAADDIQPSSGLGRILPSLFHSVPPQVLQHLSIHNLWMMVSTPQFTAYWEAL